jgi:transposase
VLIDNCSVHNDDLETVRTLIEGRGAILIYTAPYSPELIPIEYMFKTWKDYLKRHHIEFGRDWHKVHMDALRSITPQMGLNFFKNTTLVELVEHHPMSEEYAASAVDVAVMLAVGIL